MSLAKRVVARPVTWLVIFSLVIGLGAYMITQIPVNQFPEVEPPIIMISCSYGETAPETVEQNVTRVLEGALANVTNLDEMTSTSSKGSSTIVLSFTWGTDLAEATDDVRDSLERIRDSLPEEAGSPTIFKFDPSSMPILRLAVRGDRSVEELYTLTTDTIQAQLERIEGVATTSVQGGRKQIVRVGIPQDRLEAYRVSLTEVASALAVQNVEGSGGDITEGGRNYVVVTAGQFKSLRAIENTVIAYRGGQAVLLRDLTDVRWDYEDADSVVYVNGEPGIYIQIMKQSGSYSIEVADQVKEQLNRINRQLPKGIEIVTVMDTTSMIRNSISQVVSSAFYGVGFAVLVLLLFLRKIRTTLIVAMAIPIAILATVIGMYFLGISFNMVSLTGLILALGMVVDGSIVILENIYQYREKGSKLTTAAVLGSQEMMTAISASTLTTVFVFVPLVIFRNRLEMIGQLVKDLSFTVVIALLVSLSVATILVPVLASYALPVYTSRQRPVRNRLLRGFDNGLAGAIRGLQAGYRAALSFVLRFRWLTLLAVLLLLAWTVTLVPKVGFQFTPAAREDTVQLEVQLPVGTPLEKTEEVIHRLEAIASEEIVGYTNIVSTAGGGGFFHRSSGSNQGNLVITLDLTAGGDDSWSAQAKMRSHYGEFPDATFSYGSFGGLGGSSSDVEVSIYCSDLNRALDTADQIKRLIDEKIPEVMEVEVDIDTGMPQVEITIDRAKAFDLGVSIRSVTSEIEAAMAGTTATIYRTGGEEYEVLVILAKEDRSDFPDLERIFTVSSSGEPIPLASIATQDKTTGPVDISRENQKRVVHVTGSLPPGSKTNVIDARLRALVAENIVQDDELSLEFTGSMSELSKSGGGLAVIALMALILVFGVMASLFQSFKDPLIILFSIPLLFIGVILMYVLTGEPFSIFSGVGIVVLIGIVVNNGIVLVNYTNLLRARGASVWEACIESGVSRLRPILMTSLTTITAMIPMAFFPGAGSEQIKPIGVTVIGGLATSTLITLILVPVLYSLFNEHRRKRKKEV
jgi:HAE1 family hydrophobic/amphiphilic exporter-1